MAKGTFVRFGDWNKALALSKSMPEAIDHSLKQTMAKVTVKAERMAVKFMSDQSLKWPPLSKQYMNKKAREKLSNKILIATSTYFQSITSKVEGYNGLTGVFKQVKTKDGQNVADIAKIHEYGSIMRNIPPRRLWSVVFKDMNSWLKSSNIFSVEAMNEIRRRGGV